jgi:hypothetical protein
MKRYNYAWNEEYLPASGQQFIQVIDICLQVLAVVERQGLGADDRFKGGRGVWKVDEGKHD